MLSLVLTIYQAPSCLYHAIHPKTLVVPLPIVYTPSHVPFYGQLIPYQWPSTTWFLSQATLGALVENCAEKNHNHFPNAVL
jgi:hypothetical protein